MIATTAWTRPKWLVRTVLTVCTCIAASAALALGPHEVALIVNDDSIESILLADVYKRLRSIPDSNVIRISLPEAVYDGQGTDISPEDFTKYIWEPVMKAIEESGARAQILACVYSCGFPTRVTSTPAMSITGVTFVRNQLPASALVEQGSYVSDLFAGPFSAGKAAGPSSTFDSSRNRLLGAMPFPAMMLAFTGNRGMALEEAIDALELMVAADSTHPAGTFFFAVNKDVRSTSRHWEYQGVADAINALEGQRSVVSTNMPEATDFPLSGFMTGARTVPLDQLQMVPGAYADNLTSFGAAFDQSAHTKVTEWMKTGAVSSGTVVEPYAIWMKFASAYVFVHYLKGCTAIESIYQSIASPLQILPMGDPLCKPWAPVTTPVISRPEGALSGLVDFSASVKEENPEVFLRYSWLVDGRIVATGRTYVCDTRNFTDGKHTVRVVVKRHLESIRHQSFAEVQVEINNGGGK